ncbi:hypothetical protein PF005_g14552 [Phytophthora fragariae]|uniref:phosphoribosylaminoimidazolesuccinocarboxamide synthase n=1 Tax=Phytophthora fragariae TaxID=53985 RepID=A0A6A3TL91_9STRA|nr:hypothetical protein PF009_g15907 [Phytophthora fragariae]KAE9001943.1 hypothetical protein PF011_g13524 [Phytophthora fragariae]KAE9102351.1 hypothetical protein PF010_g14131 [Phytophthora fragariae]KAE9103616.1 hypothetical protein PF007_g14343 [Phytophthora fragariae]KAE9139422.1 hypothetical protein PF006_g13742 [Phytophthora fragariae]
MIDMQFLKQPNWESARIIINRNHHERRRRRSQEAHAYVPVQNRERAGTDSHVAACAEPGAPGNPCNVREVYVFEDRVLLESRRQSAFDRALASAPFKICVLTITSFWWFNQTQHIVANHLLGVLHPSAMLCKKCTVFSEEFMVRGYITDSTSIPTTKMAADFCGHKLPDGFKQHKKLPENLVTPSTKDDELVSVGLGGGGQRAYYPGAVGLLREEDARRYILLCDLTGSTLI